MSAPVFEARFSGRCNAACGEPIVLGENVTYVDDVIVHAACSRDTGLREQPEVICQSCWLTQPCDCEDDQ